MKEGWLPCQGRVRSHYFRNGKSLCAKYSLKNESDAEDLTEIPGFHDAFRTPNNSGCCARCHNIKMYGKYKKPPVLPMNAIEQRFEDERARKRRNTMDFRKRFGLNL